VQRHRSEFDEEEKQENNWVSDRIILNSEYNNAHKFTEDFSVSKTGLAWGVGAQLFAQDNWLLKASLLGKVKYD
jgi:opacity protein-like surface antigen